jgi:hypothetical protein
MIRLLGAVSALAVASLISLAGQGAAPTAQKGASIKTAWGEPDLQGIWTRDYDIPLQRPTKYRDQEFFTEAQLAELDKIRAERPGNETRAARGTEQDLAGAYNVVFTSRRPTARRTSLVVDPPDGRIPPLTPAVQQRNRSCAS